MSAEQLSNVWPGWEIEKELGRGSYGVVYRAVHREHGIESYAAVKVISIPQNKTEIDSLRYEGMSIEESKTYLHGIVNDFVNEIRMMQSFKGAPNAVSIEDFAVIEKNDDIGWDIYIRMELLKPLNEFTSDKNLTESNVIKIGLDICTVLEMCERHNIIHRDIKPENIFVNKFGYFKLGDFGIARQLENMTSELSSKGTPGYMAPEVFISNKYDASVDTYSLGIVLYKLLNRNRLPFLGLDKQILNPTERATAIERRKSGEPLPPPCDASDALARVILKACAHNPNNRYRSATEFKKALITVKNGVAKAADDNNHITTSEKTVKLTPVPPPKPEPAKKSSSARGVIIASLVTLVVLIGIGIFSCNYIKSAIGNSDETTTKTYSTDVTETVKVTETTGIIDISGEPEKTFTSGDFEVAIYNGKAAISGYTGSNAKIEIPSEVDGYKVIAIDKQAFWSRSGITEISIPDSVAIIGDWAFTACTNLQKITVDKNNSAFCDINGVLFTKDATTLISYPSNNPNTEYHIPDSVVAIEKSAFYGCGHLVEVTIPETVSTIGNGAFYWCADIKTINIPKNVEKIGTGAFSACYSIENFKIDPQNTVYCDIDGVLYSKDKTTLIVFPVGKESDVFTIPDGTHTISSEAFYDISYAIKVEVPEDITLIEEKAFYSCDKLTIICNSNSYAALYAKENDLEFDTSLSTIKIGVFEPTSGYNGAGGK